MDIRLKVIQVMPEESGISKAGKQWSKQTFIGETYDQYPKRVAISVFNGKTQVPTVDSDVNVAFDIDSRSFIDRNGNERWSTEVQAYNVEIIQPGINQVDTSFSVHSAPAPVPQPQQQHDDDFLPF